MNASVILDKLREPVVLKSLQLSITISLSLLSGIAACLHSWVIPLLRIGDNASTKIAQFKLVIALGYRYLQPSSRLLGATLLGTTSLLYSHSDPQISRLWRHYAAAAAIVISTSPWEEWLIFPTNDRIIGMGDELQREGKVNQGKATQRNREEEDESRKKELDGLLGQWQRWHVGRVVLPFLAAVVSGFGLVASP